jgi:membrane-bound lytic murein transglycosylase D
MGFHRIKLGVIFLLLLGLIFSCSSILPFNKTSTPQDPHLTGTKSNHSDSFEQNESPQQIGSENNNPPPLPVDIRAQLIGIKAEPQSIAEKNKQVQPHLDEALEFCQTAQDFWQKGELENAVEALDQAYALILTVDINDQPQLFQQKDDLRFLISKRILEIYASRNIVVNGKHKAIPRILNRYVEAEIKRFIYGEEKDFFIESYKRSGRFRPLIESALQQAGLPPELSWLPLIESGFKVNALSRARALGIWQFIPSTGYKFGLKRDKYIDERLDPIKSTEAAIAYLKELHLIFGDWTTVMAAYNCGEGRVLRIIREQNINYLDNFWDLYERLPFETARYVPRFLATLHIINNLEHYGLDAIEPYSPLEFETVEVNKQVHLKDVAEKIHMPLKVLLELNPELRYRISPPDKYTLRVPPGKPEMLLAKIDEIPVSSLPKPTFVYHRVRRGETLSTIARKYRTRVARIMRANNLRRSNYIVAGKLLKIPQKGYKYRPHKINRIPKKKNLTHTVIQGDSLWIIARRYGTTTQKIRKFNNLPTTELTIGQVLKLPQNSEVSIVGNGFKTYRVKRGDNPAAIAQRHEMVLDRFLRINKLTVTSTIYPGQKLFIE